MGYNIFKKFGHALHGIAAAFKEEPHMRFHCFAAAITISAGFYFGISVSEWLLIILCIGLVMTAEMFNAALENMVDLAQPAQHPLAGKIKDIAAGAVLVVSIMASVVGILIFWPHICALLD